MTKLSLLCAAVVSLSLGGCVTTSMQGYADRDLPSHPVSHVAVLIIAPPPLSESFQTNLAIEASKRGVTIEDASAIFPPTRQYSDAEIKQDLKARGVDGLLVINVGDSGVVREYAGTMFSGNYSGTATVNTFGSMSNVSYGGTSFGVATPIIRQSRQTSFNARLVEPSSGRNLWVGSGQVSAGGALFVGNGTSASNAAAAIFNDLQSKAIIPSPQS
ncbi:MAG: hypothetical protein ACLPGW_11915 [Roseiarcus sp.]